MKNKILYKVVTEKEIIFLGQNNFQKFSFQDLETGSVNTEEKSKEIALQNYINNPQYNYIGFIVSFATEDNRIKGKIKINDVFFGKNFKNFSDETVIDCIEDEERFYKKKLEYFLETKSRKIIPDDYFIKLNEEFSVFLEKNNHLNTEDYIKSKTQKYNTIKERTSSINTLDEAIEFLIQDYGTEKIGKIQDETILTQFRTERNHFGSNMYLRNLFFHGNQNENFKKAIREYGKISFASGGELGEGYLEDAFWRKLNHCEINSEIQQKLKEDYEEIELLTQNYCKSRGAENVNDLNEEDFDGLLKIYKNRNKGKEGSILRLQLQSYNIIDKDINDYIALENDNNDRDYYAIKYEKYAILAGVKDNDKKMYESLKQDYFQYHAINKKLGSFIHKIKEQHIINDL